MKNAFGGLKRLRYLGGLLLLGASLAFAGGAWEPDRRANQENSGAAQHEPMVAANPNDPNNSVVVSKDYRTGMHNYIFTTTDAGQTWTEQPFPASDPAVTSDTDPAVFFRPDGRAYLLWTAIIGWPNAGIYTSWSDDRGLTWSPAVAITPPRGHFDDKAWLAFDTTGGPYSGTLYTAWTRFGDAEIYGSRSTDGGATWSLAAPISSGDYLHYNDGPQLQVLPDGTLLVIFLHDASPGQTGTLVAARSTDGGQTFGTNTPLFTVVQPPYNLPGEQWRLFTYHSLVRDPNTGRLTMIWGDYRNAASNGIDILLSSSTDSGQTWSAPSRLNDDPAGAVRDQWFPSLAVAPDGRVEALWLDRREDPNNRLYHAYARSSTDGGTTWLPSVRVSTAPSDPNLNIPPKGAGIGDYIGLSAGHGVFWGAWVDVRNGNQDIYAARRVFTPGPTVTRTATPARTATPVSPTPTPCRITFTDVPPEAYFYEPVRYLYCMGAVSGYADNTFRPYNNTTRGQAAKMVALGFRWALANPANPTFSDVPYGSTFYTYVETSQARGVVGGYPCGNPEPCDPQNRPYFRPNAEITRGQIAKVVVLSAGWPLLSPPEPTFSDVPAGSVFYPYVETAVSRRVLGGYTCGNPEPCDPQNGPYFRPGNNATRGQIAKVVHGSITQP